jgi:hypothetical protein
MCTLQEGYNSEPALFMTVRREITRKLVPREAYLVSRMQRNRRTLSILRFARKSSRSAIAAEVLTNNAGEASKTDTSISARIPQLGSFGIGQKSCLA